MTKEAQPAKSAPKTRRVRTIEEQIADLKAKQIDQYKRRLATVDKQVAETKDKLERAARRIEQYEAQLGELMREQQELQYSLADTGE